MLVDFCWWREFRWCVGAVICDGGVTFAGGGIFVRGVIFVGDVHHYSILFFSFSPSLRRRCSILRAFPM